LQGQFKAMQTLEQLKNGALKGAVSLKLSEKLTYFPPEIFDLAETLEVLDLSNNLLSALPPDFGRLKKLRILFCSNNQFTVLPEVLGDCPVLDIVGFKSNLIDTITVRSLNSNLRWLILTDNKISNLPGEIGNCSRMQKLMLAGNQLEELPKELISCKNLALLRISANRLMELPDWLLSLPKLSWIAFSGNPYCISPEIQPILSISWDELKLTNLLGEGASGVISRATWNRTEKSQEVAVKLFKGPITSDGLPEDEMNTCISAGLHAGLVQIIGKIIGHPSDKQGLVMELIPDRFYNLGDPPSLVTCTRDVFPQDLKLPFTQIVKVAHTIASVAAQLHSKGIMHADLYAHNILIDEQGTTLFGDFGAACFYNKKDILVSDSLERLEVSAFGYLLDDLLSLLDASDKEGDSKIFRRLRDLCLASNVSSRPSFKVLEDELFKLLN
jgi:hypothetical protein